MGHKHRPHNTLIWQQTWKGGGDGVGKGREGNGQKKDSAFLPPPPTSSDLPRRFPQGLLFLLPLIVIWYKIKSGDNTNKQLFSANAGVSQQCPPKTKRFSTVRSSHPAPKNAKRCASRAMDPFRSFYVQDWKLWQKSAGKMLINISEKRQQQK